MPEQDFMNKIRQWDNQIARWMMRHFYFIFFQIILVIIFVFWFTNSLQIIFHREDLHNATPPPLLTEKILLSQSVSQTLIVVLLLFNSFWTLYIFNILQRLTGLLKDINFSLLRGRGRDKNTT